MEPIILAGVLGAIGGFTRGSVGLLKALSLKRRVLWPYWCMTVAVAVIIGVFTGLVLSSNPKVSLLAGYAGTDIVEGVYKSFRNRKTRLYSKYEKKKK